MDEFSKQKSTPFFKERVNQLPPSPPTPLSEASLPTPASLKYESPPTCTTTPSSASDDMKHPTPPRLLEEEEARVMSSHILTGTPQSGPPGRRSHCLTKYFLLQPEYVNKSNRGAKCRFCIEACSYDSSLVRTIANTRKNCRAHLRACKSLKKKFPGFDTALLDREDDTTNMLPPPPQLPTEVQSRRDSTRSEPYRPPRQSPGIPPTTYNGQRAVQSRDMETPNGPPGIAHALAHHHENMMTLDALNPAGVPIKRAPEPPQAPSNLVRPITDTTYANKRVRTGKSYSVPTSIQNSPNTSSLQALRRTPPRACGHSSNSTRRHHADYPITLSGIANHPQSELPSPPVSHSQGMTSGTPMDHALRSAIANGLDRDGRQDTQMIATINNAKTSFPTSSPRQHPPAAPLNASMTSSASTLSPIDPPPNVSSDSIHLPGESLNPSEIEQWENALLDATLYNGWDVQWIDSDVSKRMFLRLNPKMGEHLPSSQDLATRIFNRRFKLVKSDDTGNG